jgi:hypothetical protein
MTTEEEEEEEEKLEFKILLSMMLSLSPSSDDVLEQSSFLDFFCK